MARRTKEEALATRELILDAAERVFYQRGVSRTSLQEIAKEAGLTRGAIYWHFENKGELFHAMMERVTLPMMARMTEITPEDEARPLDKIRRNTAAALREIAHNPQVRRVFEIAMKKVEYVDEMQEMQQRKISGRNECMDDMQHLLQIAQKLGHIKADAHLRNTTIGLFALVGGIKYNWLLDPEAFDLEAVGLATLDAYLAGLKASQVV
ncbi:TetR family transcriptional regulator [Rhodoferax sp. TBRC 17660]|uniref:TetR family transcriptional regulator n=1 Tax=Rhodoferax potami TaxID=3068338 RepID=A0ABU3KIV6_9BURK|nr:TetR family transcriptional regulator [Rhodoferax sp. TBRC 17660]MDT7517705.1 TetR family transcriptional regulator [Rhodoferax sp. TBRC 17660]